MEAGVEYGNLGNAGHHGLAGTDTGEVVGVVQRAKLAALFDGCDNLLVHDNGAGELLTAVQNAVTYGRDLRERSDYAVLGRYEGIENQLDGFLVVGHLDVDLVIFLAFGLQLEVAAGDADAVTHTLGDNLLGLHIDELILDGGAAGIDNQNLHDFVHPFFIYYSQNSLSQYIIIALRPPSVKAEARIFSRGLC